MVAARERRLPPRPDMHKLRGSPRRAVSSAVEHCFHTAGVTGSSPVPPTNRIKNLAANGLGPHRAACRHSGEPGSTGVGESFQFPARIGLGTYLLGETAQHRERDLRAVRHALEVGYRLIDTAERYADGGAERLIGEALQGFGAGRRPELFLVSKVDGRNATHRGTVRACEASIERMGCDYLDLYLLHGPEPRRFEETLRGFDELLRRGLVRRVGVSNFSVHDLKAWRAAGQTVGMAPEVSCNQVPYSADCRWIEQELLPYQRQHLIPTMAYSPLGSGKLVQHPFLGALGQQLRLTPAQIALAWCLHDPDIVAIPKSIDPRRIEENLQAGSVRLSRADWEQISRVCGPSSHWLPRAARGVVRRLKQLARR
jgi:diketogulonate reductase-like aldo/keto reductase